MGHCSYTIVGEKKSEKQGMNKKRKRKKESKNNIKSNK